MATFTALLALRKPSTADNINVTLDLSDNFEAIDDKFVAVDAAIAGHETRLDRLDGNFSEMLLATGFMGGVLFPGDNGMADTGTFVVDGTRRVRIEAHWIGRCTAAGGTGHAGSIQRSMDGVNWTDVGDLVYTIYPSSASDHSTTFERNDTPPAGTVRYRLRLVGHGINGNAMSQARVTVWNAGYDV